MKKNASKHSDNEMSSQDSNSDKPILSSASCDQSDHGIAPVINQLYSPRVDRTSEASYIKDITRPVPSNQIQQCLIKREKRGPFATPFYQIFGEESNPIFIAKNKSSMICVKFLICEPLSGKIIGKIESDSKGLNYKISGPNHCNFDVQYTDNFLGRNGCRSFQVIFENDKKFVSKPPMVIDGNYYQDFHDLNTTQSVKNFVLIDEKDEQKEVCVFVKSDTNDFFTLRIAEPFTLFCGFAVALTSLHTGIFHR